MNYVRKNSDLKIVKIYCDNGYSGTNFSRAAFGEMMQDIKSGIIRCVIVKDLSRLGRNHIETEQYIRTVFPFFNVRFIAVNDHFDSLHPEGDLMAYAEGKIDKDTFLRKKENIREMFETEDVEAETKTAVVRTDLENLLEEVQSTADDSWLTREVLKVFVKEIWIFPESEMKIIWKPEWALEGAGKDSIGEKEK